MIHGNVGDPYLHRVEAIGNSADPLIAANRSQAKRNGFIETRSCDFHGVSNAFQIGNGDFAGANRHSSLDKGKIAYSLFIRHHHMHVLSRIPRAVAAANCPQL